MRIRLTFILLVLNAVALSCLYYLEKNNRTDDLLPQDLKISEYAGRAEYIKIESALLPQARILQKQREQWRMVQPIEWLANDFAVSRILNQLQFLDTQTRFDVKEIVAAGRSLADYGLADPPLQLTFGSKEDSITLRVGDPTEIGNRLYVLTPNQETILVVDKELFANVLVSVNELRESTIFSLPIFSVDSMQVDIQNGESTQRTRLNKGVDGWLFDVPFQALADDEKVTALLNQFHALRIKEFVEDTGVQAALLGLAEPKYQISLSNDRDSQTLLVGNELVREAESHLYYAKLENNNTLFVVDLAPFLRLNQLQVDLRERALFAFDENALESVELSKLGQELRFEKFEGKAWNGSESWRVIRTNEETQLDVTVVDQGVMTSLIELWDRLQVLQFFNDAPTKEMVESLGLLPPQSVLTLRGREQGSDWQQTWLLGNLDDTGTRLYLQKEGENSIYMVDSDLTYNLPVAGLHYKNRILHELPTGAEILSLQLERWEDAAASEDKILDLQRGENPSLAPVIEALPEAERSSAYTLVQYAKKFIVRSYLDKTGSLEQAFLLGERSFDWRYRLSIVVRLPGAEGFQEKEMTYYFTDRIGGQLQGGLEPKQGLTFSVTKEMIEALFSLGFDRPIATADDPIEQVVE